MYINTRINYKNYKKFKNMESQNTKETVIDFLKNKNVFIFDTETTGLPERTSKWGTYWDYKMNEKYDSSRIVSIAWASFKTFDKNKIINDINNEIENNNKNSNNDNDNHDKDNDNHDKDNDDINKIHHHIRYPEGFSEIPTTHIHGISLNDALTKGIPFGFILNNFGLTIALLEADYIVAHNVGFDYHVLMNELYRIVTNNEPSIPYSLLIRENANLCMEHLQDLYNNGRVICTGQLSTNICKIEFPTKNIYLGNKKNYKMPKLSELYKYFYGTDFENAHSAEGDVKALISCLAKM
jgi:DNA polymerase III epsilon subunit-like protein